MGEHIWLDFNKNQPLFDDGDFEIDFIGRRTMYQGYYGHMGGSGQSIIVDRIIAMREVKH